MAKTIFNMADGIIIIQLSQTISIHKKTHNKR